MRIPGSLRGSGFLAMSLHLLTVLNTLKSSAMHILVDALGQRCTQTHSTAAPLPRTTELLCRHQILLGRDARKRGPFDWSFALSSKLLQGLEGCPTTSLSLGLKGKSRRQETLKSIFNTARHIWSLCMCVWEWGWGVCMCVLVLLFCSLYSCYYIYMYYFHI